MKPAIVISAYDRPEALSRLLGSISAGVYPDKVPLVFSVDFGGTRRKEILEVANSFKWDSGTKEIIEHEAHLGVSAHFFFAGSLVNRYGSIIRLEDDHFVSPMFYEYGSKALDFYKDDPRIAGISLYNVWFNGITKEPFIPYLDDGDVYFMQLPWSQGQAFHASQWESYTAWYRQNDPNVSARDPLHESWIPRDEEEWFPPAAKYLVETNRFYVFPRESLSTNFGDAGRHFRKPSRYFQVPLQTRRRDFRFQSLDDCVAVYDAFQEIVPERMFRLTTDLDDYDVEMDLNGTKAPAKIKHPFVVTSQPCLSPLRSWGLALYPREANIVEGIPGTELKLCRGEDLRPGGFAGLRASFHRYEYARSRLSVGLATHIMFWMIRQAEVCAAWLRKIFRR